MKLKDYFKAKPIKPGYKRCPNCRAKDQPTDGNYVFCGFCLKKSKVKK